MVDVCFFPRLDHAVHLYAFIVRAHVFRTTDRLIFADMGAMIGSRDVALASSDGQLEVEAMTLPVRHSKTVQGSTVVYVWKGKQRDRRACGNPTTAHIVGTLDANAHFQYHHFAGQ